VIGRALSIGKNAAVAVGTLVERSTRYVMLLHLPDGRFPAQVDAAALVVISSINRGSRRDYESSRFDRNPDMN